MNHIFSKLIYLVIIIFISGCSVSGYQSYYKEYPITKELHNNKDAQFLKDGEVPQVYYSDNLNADMTKMASKHYLPIGYSSFNGKLSDVSEVIEQAKKVKAVLVLYTKKYTNTQNVSGAYMIPQTNYMSGSAYGTGGYATFQGTQTTNTLVPYSINQSRFDQEAVFFIKGLKKFRFGIHAEDISRDKRIELGETGALVTLIFENTPAYNSDILVNDIITYVDGIKIKDYNHLKTILADYSLDKKNIIFKVLRGKEEKDIILTLD
ncbi:PDZ domain-containing protein [Sulfurospirillum cavolei]|uniref:PDZ domain-containing protein n=1 Tax=Sulfurospirillum cavolei TaxID=366522 RepID=UPI0005A62468|nr:PDZ domain-containing protein [Sulfurospirillum cavolei]